MSCNSDARAAEYRQMVEDVMSGGLLDEEEILELRDLLARAERRALAASQPGCGCREWAEQTCEDPACPRKHLGVSLPADQHAEAAE